MAVSILAATGVSERGFGDAGRKSDGPAFRQARSRGLEKEGIQGGLRREVHTDLQEGVVTLLGRVNPRGSLCLLSSRMHLIEKGCKGFNLFVVPCGNLTSTSPWRTVLNKCCTNANALSLDAVCGGDHDCASDFSCSGSHDPHSSLHSPGLLKRFAKASPSGAPIVSPTEAPTRPGFRAFCARHPPMSYPR